MDATVNTYRDAGPAAAVGAVADGDEPPAGVLAPVLVSRTTSSTITTTPITEASRYAAIRIPPSRCGGR